MVFGTILLVIGVVFLLQNLGVVSGEIWDIVWPILIIALGLSFFFKKSHHGGCCNWFKSSKEEKKEE